MSIKKRGIMLKSLTLEDEGMQELINPVPLELVIDEDADLDLELEVDRMLAEENQAVKDVLNMLEDTVLILETSQNKPK